MITDHTLDLTLIELARTMKALHKLRKVRKSNAWVVGYIPEQPAHAAALRASMDLTRKLADLRQGR